MNRFLSTLLPEHPWQHPHPACFNATARHLAINAVVLLVTGAATDRAWQWWASRHTELELSQPTVAGWGSVILAHGAATALIVGATAALAATGYATLGYLENRRLIMMPTGQP